MFGRLSGSGSKSFSQLAWLLNSEIVGSVIAFEQGWIVAEHLGVSCTQSSPGTPWVARAVLTPNSDWGLATKSP